MTMGPNLVLVITAAAVMAAGVYLLLERSLTRILIGVVMISNAINLLFLVASGAAGLPPIYGAEGRISDPLPQAMVLTAIVITLGVTAFLLTMAYRSWQLHQHDEVQDDLEDRRVARRAAADLAAFEDLDTTAEETLDEEAAQVHDEMVESRGAGGEDA